MVSLKEQAERQTRALDLLIAEGRNNEEQAKRKNYKYLLRM